MKTRLLLIVAVLVFGFTSNAQQKLIHYWHFNTFSLTSSTAVNPSTIVPLKADYSTLDTSKAFIAYRAITGTSSAYLSYWDNVSPGDTVNARLGFPAGVGLRPRNPWDSMQLMLFIPTLNYQNITIKYGTQRSGSGPTTQTFDYSLDSGLTYITTGLSKLTYTVTSTANPMNLDTVSISNAAAFNNKNLIFRIRFGPAPGAGNNRFDNFTVEGDTMIVAASGPPAFKIGQVNTTNPTTGVADSLNGHYTLSGVVYGFNQRTPSAGTQFLLRDNTGGVTVFHVSKTFGYTVAEGDSLVIPGTIQSFRGLIEFAPDTIIKIASGKTLKTPTAILTLGESNENDLVKMNNLMFYTTPTGGNWPATSTNVLCHTQGQTDTIIVRVLTGSTLAGTALPGASLFNIIGMVQQFSTSSAAPFAFNGYEILPRTTADVLSGLAPPDAVTGLGIATNLNSATLSWTKPATYADATMSTLVFVKPASAITQGTPNKAASYYTANTDLTQNGTAYQNDANAKCVLNSDSTSITILGLTQNTTYYTIVYAVRVADSTYSIAASSSGVTQSLPAPTNVSNTRFTNTTTTSTVLSWTKDVSYIDSTMTTLVFIKPTSTINKGTPNKSALTYVANASNYNNGSSFQNDTSAKCVFNGTANTVSISGLASSTKYNFLIYVVKKLDSTYSSGVTDTISTLTPLLPPASISATKFTNTSTTATTLSWTKDPSYVDSTMTTLVFIKPTASITKGTPNKSASNYIANASNYNNGTSYQNDTAAKCVFNGTTNTVSISGLSASTKYNFLIYVVRKVDSSYSSGATDTMSTLAPAPVPTAVNGLTLSGSSYTSARATWTKPANYDNANWTTLVFAKSDLPITVGTPTKGQANYTSNSNFGLGTSYQNDALGYCVFKGDTNTVNILGLLQNKTYQVMVVIVRDADSVYSPAANTNGTVTSYPLYTISQINTTNATTGNPDSLGVKARIRGIVYGFNQVATSGFQFVIKDNTGGITAFNISKSFGYLVTEGDNLEVGGIVSVNRGLITFNCDTLIKLSSGNTLTNPTLVTSLNQTTENNLVRINNIEFYTSPGTTWPLANTTILCHTHGLNDTIAVSILATSGLAGNPLPTTPSFSIIGLGTQVSTSVSAPFLFNGYRIIPRNNSDIIAIPVPADTLSKFTLKSPANNSSINLQGDPTTTVNFSWKTAISSITGLSAKYSIELDSLTGTFANGIKLQSNAAGLDSNYTTTYGALSTLLNLIPSKQVTLKWRIKATAGTYVKYDDTVFVVTFIRGQFTGINELGSTHQITLYPNPATNQIAIGSNHSIESISIIDITGNMMDSPMTKDNTTIYCDINQLVSGVYFVKVICKDQSVVYKKFIKE